MTEKTQLGDTPITGDIVVERVSSTAFLELVGTTSGVITVEVQPAAGTYNFNLPINAGATGQVLTSQGGGGSPMTWATPSTGSPANPTAVVGLTVVNGSASTFMRSDAAPPLDQTIAPSWTGLHTFTGGVTVAPPSGDTNVSLNSPLSTNQANIVYQAAGTTKWIVGKDGSNNFAVWDQAFGADAIAVVTNGGGVRLRGTNTNDSAAAGNIGEYISSTVVLGSAVSLTNNTPANVTSISLTAGDWDVSCTLNLTTVNITTGSVNIIGSISTTTATLDGTDTRESSLPLGSGPIGGSARIVVGPSRFSLSATTTIFMVAEVSFTGGSCSAYGTIRARRMR